MMVSATVECIEKGGDCGRGRAWGFTCPAEALSGLITLFHARHEGHRLRISLSYTDPLTGKPASMRYEPPD